MRILIKIGAGMMLLAIILVGISFGMLRAHAENAPGGVITGSKMIKTETRAIDAQVVNIEANGPVDVIIMQGSTASMSVSAEERLLSHVTTTQKGNTLVIDLKDGSYHFYHPIRVNLVLPNLQQLALHGSGDAKVAGFSGDKMALVLRGSGDMDFNGNYQHITANVMGSGDLDLDVGNGADADLTLQGSGGITIAGQNRQTTVHSMGSGDLSAESLRTDDLKLDVMGSGDASVYARQSAVINLHGSGDIEVHGNPTRREINRTGSGDVSWEG